MNQLFSLLRTCVQLVPTIMALCLSIPASGQVDIANKLFGTSDDAGLIARATDSALLVVRVEYVLVDSEGYEYGTPETDYFGVGTYVGAVLTDGILLPFAATKPWEKDRGYVKSDTLFPKIYQVLARMNGQRHFDTLAMPNFDSLNERLTLLHTTHKMPGMAVNYKAAPGEVWLLTFAPKSPSVAGQDSLDYKVEVVQQTLTTSKDSSYFQLAKVSGLANPLGGVLITAQVTTGRVSFQVLGLVNKDFKDRVYRMPNKIPKQQPKLPTRHKRGEDGPPGHAPKNPADPNKARGNVRSRRG